MNADFNPEKITLPTDMEGRMFFTPKEFGKLLGVHKATIFRWARDGYLKMTKFSPRCSMVPKTELERYMRGEMMYKPAPQGERMGQNSAFQPTEPEQLRWSTLPLR